MNQPRRIFLIVAVSTFILAGPALAQYDYTTFTVPSATSTMALAISGNTVVGGYQEGQIDGFIYNGTSFTTFNVPSSTETLAYGISGNNIVGSYTANGASHGFLYNGTSYTTLNDPLGVKDTLATGISGTNIVGTYFYNSGPPGHQSQSGFLYNGSTYTTLNVPSASDTAAYGIDGNIIVGTCYINGDNGFIYNGTSYMILNDPLGVLGTDFRGISGNNIVGFYYDAQSITHDFLYNISMGIYTTLNDPPGAVNIGAEGISGSNITGYYLDSNGNGIGFIGTPAPVPEPSILALAGFSGLGLLACRRKKGPGNTPRDC
jgi:hypothetical protein